MSNMISIDIEILNQVDIIRRTADRGMKLAQHPPKEGVYIDIFQHLQDEIARLENLL